MCALAWPNSGNGRPEILADRLSLARWSGEAEDQGGARGQFAALLPVMEHVLDPEDPEVVDARADLAHWPAEVERGRHGQ